MKKIILISLLLYGVILGGCSQSKNKLFEKSKECSTLGDQVIKEIEFQYGKIQDGLTENGLQVETPQVFYSPTLNSCIYRSEIIQDFDNENLYARYFLEIVDFLKKETIIEVVCDFKTSDHTSISGIPQHSSEDMQEFSACTEPFHNKLDELKGE